MNNPTSTPELRRARRAYMIVGAIVPLALTAIGVMLMILWLPQVPPTIAIHWSANGEADGFGPAWSTPVLTVVLGTGLAALFSAIGFFSARAGEWGPTLRFLAALNCGVTTMLITMVTGSFGLQRGLEQAEDAPSILPALGLGAATGLAVGIIAWFVQPAASVRRDDPAAPLTSDSVALAPGERAAWLRTATMARPGMIAIVGVTVLQVALAVVTAASGGEMWWLFAGLAVLFSLLAASMCVFRVSVTDAGLRVRSAAGIPTFVIPLENVADAGVVRVQPMSEFGGFGIRTGLDGRSGVVLRTGDAIQVERHKGRPFVVTVDDASTGAALLTTLADRAAARSASSRP
jgi:hypothetical protein